MGFSARRPCTFAYLAEFLDSAFRLQRAQEIAGNPFAPLHFLALLGAAQGDSAGILWALARAERVAAGPDTEGRVVDHRTVCVAAFRGCVECLELLRARGVVFTASAAEFAARGGRVEALRWMSEKRACGPDRSGPAGQAPGSAPNRPLIAYRAEDVYAAAAAAGERGTPVREWFLERAETDLELRAAIDRAIGIRRRIATKGTGASSAEAIELESGEDEESLGDGEESLGEEFYEGEPNEVLFDARGEYVYSDDEPGEEGVGGALVDPESREELVLSRQVQDGILYVTVQRSYALVPLSSVATIEAEVVARGPRSTRRRQPLPGAGRGYPPRTVGPGGSSADAIDLGSDSEAEATGPAGANGGDKDCTAPSGAEAFDR